MMKEMVVKIPINDECNTKSDISNLIIALMSEAGDRMFSIDSVEIDGEKVFGVDNPNGFKKEYFKTT